MYPLGFTLYPYGFRNVDIVAAAVYLLVVSQSRALQTIVAAGALKVLSQNRDPQVLISATTALVQSEPTQYTYVVKAKNLKQISKVKRPYGRAK